MNEEPRADQAASFHSSPSGATPDEPPPLGTWGRMYALVLGNLAFWILVFYAFTRAFE